MPVIHARPVLIPLLLLLAASLCTCRARRDTCLDVAAVDSTRVTSISRADMSVDAAAFLAAFRSLSARGVTIRFELPAVTDSMPRSLSSLLPVQPRASPVVVTIDEIEASDSTRIGSAMSVREAVSDSVDTESRSAADIRTTESTPSGGHRPLLWIAVGAVLVIAVIVAVRHRRR